MVVVFVVLTEVVLNVGFLSATGKDVFLGAGKRFEREDPAFTFFAGRTSVSSSSSSLARARGRDTLITRFLDCAPLSVGLVDMDAVVVVGAGAVVSSSSDR